MNNRVNSTKSQCGRHNNRRQLGMKYPQLVSARAVNAISDWLVSRLERLGIDDPLVYSRLLLSLLHTPLQLNALDLADVYQDQIKLKGYLGGRKFRQRLSTSEAETLKRIAAVDSLIDATASEEQKTDIEILVEELCEKLREIEKQTSLDCEANFIKCSSNLNTNNHQPSSLPMKKKTFPTTNLPSTNSEDPTKRYYRAFPPLSKNLDDRKVRLSNPSSNMNWPKGPKCGNAEISHSVGLCKVTACVRQQPSSTSISNNCGTAGVKKKQKRRRNNNMSFGGNNTIGGVQGLSKSFHRKVFSDVELCNSFEPIDKKILGGMAPKMATTTGRAKNQNLWDTNFEGQWEMGHDRIREFILKQKKETDTSRYVQAAVVIQRDHETTDDERPDDELFSPQSTSTTNNTTTATSSSLSSSATNLVAGGGGAQNLLSKPGFKHDGGGVIGDEGYSTPDTFTSFCELNDIVTKTAANNNLLEPRRLYEREISQESIDKGNNRSDNNVALFEAKFNSSVEALWSDNVSIPSRHLEYGQEIPDNQDGRNITDFWSKYLKHQYNPPDPSSSSPPAQPLQLIPQASLKNAFACGGGDQRFEHFQNLNYKKHEFIESGTNLNSSIWSCNNESLSQGCLGKFGDGAAWSDQSDQSSFGNINFSKDIGGAWGGTTTLKSNYFGNNQNENVYNVEDHFAFTKENNGKSNPKWSDNSCDQQYLAYQSAKSLNEPNNQSNKNVDGISEIIDGTLQHGDKEPAVNNCSRFNHSESSGFIKFFPKAVNHYGYYDEQYRNGLELYRKRYAQECELHEEENLLVSERTHFRPIKQTYVDGYEFDIPCHLDEIKYQRSDSGSLYFDSDKYMELKIEKLSGGDGSADGGECKYYSNHFRLKFCVKQNEKYCQTDSSFIMETSSKKYLDTFNTSSYRSGSTYDMDEVDFDTACYREQAKIMKYCVCFEQRYSSDYEDHSGGADLVLINRGNNNVNYCTVHPFSNTEMENWTMNCLSRRCEDIEHVHTLWGNCTTCDMDTKLKSNPASDMLRAELSIDGDKIMSDLKYMQNLFIGADWDDEEDEDGKDENDDETIDCFESLEVGAEHILIDDTIGDHTDDDSDKCNVNKLISDLLKPETAKSLTEVLGPSQGGTILHEIALNEKSSKKMDSLVNHLNFVNNNNNNTLFVSENEVFGLWKKYDGDWEDCRNLKSIIENVNEKESEAGNNFSEFYFDESCKVKNNNEQDAYNRNHQLFLMDVDKLCGKDEYLDNEDQVLATTNDKIFRKSEHNSSFGKSSRFDRKRRHSSSQNFSDDILAHGKFMINADDSSVDLAATVLTCEYWAKYLKLLPQYESEVKATSSILKHVAMVSRPLTR